MSDLDPGSPEAIRRDMLDALDVIVYSATVDPLELSFANQYALKYFGVSAEAISGDLWLALVHPEDRLGVLAAWTAARKRGHHYRHEHRLRLADGTYRRFLAQAAPRPGSSEPVIWYGVLTPLRAAPRRGPAAGGKVDIYPLRDDAGEIHLVEVHIWDGRPEDTGAKLHPDGSWYRIDSLEGT
jgi:PAS domain-containing protein